MIPIFFVAVEFLHLHSYYYITFGFTILYFYYCLMGSSKQGPAETGDYAFAASLVHLGGAFIAAISSVVVGGKK